MYNKSSDWQSDLKRRFTAGGCPATFTIIALSAVVWLWLSIVPSEALIRMLGFSSRLWPIPYLWTAVTWPILNLDNPFFLLIEFLWFYNVGSSLERSWGTRRFVGFYLAINALTVVALFVGGLILHTYVAASGIFFGAAAVTIAWCLLNRRETVCLGFVLPIPAIWIAYLTMAMVWWDYRPVLGLFALAGCAASWWYVQKDRSRGFGGTAGNYRFRMPDISPPRRPESDGKSAFSWSRFKREREERRRLEAMFRRSGFDEKDDR